MKRMLTSEEMKEELKNPKLDPLKRSFYTEIVSEKTRIENNISRFSSLIYSLSQSSHGRQTTLDLWLQSGR